MSDITTTDIFLKNLIKSTIKGTGGPTNLPNFWKTLNSNGTNISYFVIKNFNTTESTSISNGINDMSLVFDKKGNLKYKDFSFINPIYSGNSTIDLNETLNNIKSNNKDIYNVSQNIVTNRNMQYILMKNKDSSTYQLLYNPIHRSTFGNYYRNISSSSLEFGTNNTLDYLFTNYCNSLKTETYYADPTCQCFINANQNELNAIYGENQIDYSNGLPSSNTGAINFLNGTPSNHQAVCGAPGCRYSGLEDSSFLSKFISNNNNNNLDCEDTNYEYMPFCASYLENAKNLNVKDKVFYNRCADIIKGAIIKYTCDNSVCKPDDTKGKYINAQNCLNYCNSNTGTTGYYCNGYECVVAEAGQDPLSVYSGQQECMDNCNKQPTIKTWYYDGKTCSQIFTDIGVNKYITREDCINNEMPYKFINNRCVRFNDSSGNLNLTNCKNEAGIQYKCANGSSTGPVNDGSGYLTKEDAILACTGPNVQTWSCTQSEDTSDFNSCKQVNAGKGQYNTEDLCKSYCYFFSCSESGQEQCKDVTTGTPTFSDQAECRRVCSKYKCGSNGCEIAQDDKGSYQSIEECRNKCTPYKCDTSSGKCDIVTDGTGEYKTITECQDNCKKVGSGIMPLIIGLVIFGVLIVIGLIVYFYLTKK